MRNCGSRTAQSIHTLHTSQGGQAIERHQFAYLVTCRFWNDRAEIVTSGWVGIAIALTGLGMFKTLLGHIVIHKKSTNG